MAGRLGQATTRTWSNKSNARARPVDSSRLVYSCRGSRGRTVLTNAPTRHVQRGRSRGRHASGGSGGSKAVGGGTASGRNGGTCHEASGARARMWHRLAWVTTSAVRLDVPAVPPAHTCTVRGATARGVGNAGADGGGNAKHRSVAPQGASHAHFAALRARTRSHPRATLVPRSCSNDRRWRACSSWCSSGPRTTRSAWRCFVACRW